MKNNAKFYIRKSEYELKEGWHSLRESKKGEFYSIDRREMDSTYVDLDYSNNLSRVLLRIDFLLDPLITQFERQSLTLFEAFGTIGGIFEILRIITSLFTGFYAQYAFRRSLIKSLKRIKQKPVSSNESGEESVKKDRSHLYVSEAYISPLNKYSTNVKPLLLQRQMERNQIEEDKSMNREINRDLEVEGGEESNDDI